MKKNIGIFPLLIVLMVLWGFKKNTPTLPDNKDKTTDEVIVEPQKKVLVWVDAQANIFQEKGRFRDKNTIKIILDSLKTVGVTGLVVDIKHSTGYTLYDSNYTGMLSSLNGLNLPDNYVQFMIDEAKARKLNIYLSINTFVFGNTTQRKGLIYDEPALKQYEAIVCDVSGNRITASASGSNSFMNPAAPVVQDRALNIIKEIATKFDVDGIILDYCRYKDITADFSDLSKQLFIQFLEEKFNDNEAKSMNFPKDIISSWKMDGTTVVPNVTGKYYKKWLYFRASVLKNFMVKARAAIKNVKPKMQMGAYAGAWYDTYYKVGVNWASQDYEPSDDDKLTFSWAYPGYKETGYAEQLDLFLSGNYFKQLMLADNPATANLYYHWWSIEGSMKGIEYVTKNKIPLYPGLDVGNVAYTSEEEISKSIKYILNRTNGGLMLFDVCHITVPSYNYLKKPLWNAIEKGIMSEQPLPVSIAYFKGKNNKGTAEIEWMTHSEHNNAYFGLQRSVDGKTYKTIAELPGRGNTSAAHTYTYIDRTPAPGINYYRLQQTDVNGNINLWNEVIAIDNRIGASVPSLYFYNDNLYTSAVVQQPMACQMFITDLSGRKVLDKTYLLMAGKNEVKTDVSFLKSGVYAVCLKINGNKNTLKFVK